MKKTFIILFFLFSYQMFAQELKFLTLQETKWLQQLNRKITIGITQLPNEVLVYKENEYKGFSIDLFNIIEKRLNLKFQYIYFTSWNDLVQAAKNKKIDIIFLAQKTTSRLQYLYFTDTVLTLQNKLITNMEKKFHSLEALNGHTLAITQGSALEEYIHSYYPKIKLIPTRDELQSLKFIAAKKVDATVLELVRASYYIRTNNLNNLIITADIAYNYYLSIASTKTLPELNIILSKTLKEIPKKEIEALKLKWGYIQEKKLFLDKQTMIYLAIAFGIIIPFSIYLILMNNRLKKEMQEKEKALQRISKLRDSKLNDMGSIISMIAHQWRQPLNNLFLLIQLMLSKQKKGRLDDETVEYVYTNTKKQIDLMSKTIDDFRDLYRRSEQSEEFDLKKLMGNLLNLMQPALVQHHIEISLHVDNKEYIINSYKSMLFQVMINIINNAKDALIESNQPNKEIKIILSQTDKEKIIQIEDNGGGISNEIIDKIFNPYFSTKKEKNGTGLGLYMTKTILEDKMQGKIEVISKKDGALFIIKLKA